MGGRKPTKLDQELQPHLHEVLHGTLLSFDPSSGSAKSQPGYAIFKAGQLMDSGFLNIGSGDDISKRLYRLSNCIRSEFERPDVLITENVPPFMANGPNGSSFATSGVIHLHQSIGVILSIWDCPKVRVSPRAWRSQIETIGGLYKKSDESDAILMGYTAIVYAARLAGIELPPVNTQMKQKLSTGEWYAE